jgi:hypothetical protein
MRRAGSIALLSLAVALPGLAACSSAPEAHILQQFFRASRLNDTTSLAGFATARFQPQTDGTITRFDIVSVSPERRDALRTVTLTREFEAVRADEAEFTRRKDTYYLENQEAIARVLKAESVKASLAGRDAEIQAAWAKLREESSQHSRKVSEAQRKLKTESVVVQLSLENPTNPVDATAREGELVTKDVTIAASVRRADGSSADRTLVVTMQQAVLKGEPEVAGKWIVTGVRDTTGSAETKTS